jgi:hypothetical protein
MLFNFIVESKAFRNQETLEKYSTKELGEIFFTMLLSLHLLGLTTRFIKDADSYCQDTVKYPMFERVYLSGTDMANVISGLRNAKELLDAKNVDIPIMELKRYLRTAFKSGGMSESLKRALFFKLQNKLEIKNSVLTSLRRDIVDTDELSWAQKKVFGDRLYQLLRKYQYKCDVLILLQKFVECRDE